jgi:hypothetical protein
MIATGLNIHAYKGADVDIEVYVKDESGAPYELTGLNYLRIYTRFEKTSFLDIPLTWVTNKYTGTLTNSQTSLLTAIPYYIEWLTISGTDYAFPVKGNLYVSDVFTTQEEAATNILTVNSVTLTIEIQNTVNAPIDSALSDTSTNPVQNKVVDAAIKFVAGALTSLINSLKTIATSGVHNDSTGRDAANAHPATAINFVVEEITGTKTIESTDSGKHFFTTAAADFDITLNAGLTHPISIFQKGAGVPRMIAGSGTPTLLGDVKTAGQNKAIAIVPESTTVYEIIGGVA